MHPFTLAYQLTPDQIKDACSRFGLYRVAAPAMITPAGVEAAFTLGLSEWRHVNTVVKSLKSIFRTLAGRLASPDTVWSQALHKAGVPESGLSLTATLAHRLECLGHGDPVALSRIFGPDKMNVLHALVSKSAQLTNIDNAVEAEAVEPTAEPDPSLTETDSESGYESDADVEATVPEPTVAPEPVPEPAEAEKTKTSKRK